MRSAKRIRQYKILGAAIFVILLVVVVVQLNSVSKSVDSAGYELNKRVNERNAEYALKNPFGFTDRVRTPQKPKGVYRIAVLGDSFIWGDGLPYEKVWSHKLENKLLAKYDSLEVMSWGQQGWSTLDEFNFFKQHGKDYDIDLLIIGWVDNDTDVGKIPQHYNTNVKKTYPIRYFFSPALAQSLVNKDNYEAGVSFNLAIYSDSNLRDYQVVLNDFHQYLEQYHVKSLMVMTTGAFWEGSVKHFKTVKPMIEKAGFGCFDLYDIAEKNLAQYTQLQLQANPVNSHPGDLMTEEYANDVEAYLEQNHYLDSLPRVKKQE